MHESGAVEQHVDRADVTRQRIDRRCVGHVEQARFDRRVRGRQFAQACFALMSVAMTRAPSAANASAVARPMPWPAAVTSARLPFSLLLIVPPPARIAMVIPFGMRLA